MSDTIGAGYSPLKAMAWMMGAVVSFTTMGVIGRTLSAQLDTFEIMLYRSIVGVIVMLGALALTGRL